MYANLHKQEGNGPIDQRCQGPWTIITWCCRYLIEIRPCFFCDLYFNYYTVLTSIWWPLRLSNGCYDLRSQIGPQIWTRQPLLPWYHVYVASNCHIIRGHGCLKTASEVTNDLGIELSDLNDICCHIFLASICFHILNEAEEEPPDQQRAPLIEIEPLF